ncbi:hypothetical protein SOVF_104550 [Spinacia oleracea]|nr:hypothetical protein SOVF_104550 [Spinacia oleracea]
MGERAKKVLRDLLAKFPGVAEELNQLLQMIDEGRAVDITEVSEKTLMKHLKKLFRSLNLQEKGDGVFMLRSRARPTLEVIGHMIQSEMTQQETRIILKPLLLERDLIEGSGDRISSSSNISKSWSSTAIVVVPALFIGPAMPSAQLLAAAAKLTEDSGEFVGPPPPALIREAESSSEAERFEEVTRIMAGKSDSPYDIVGVNYKMPADNIKKRYWKLSLMVHPDKCPHPQAHQAFIKLNKAFKDLQDPDKKKALDDKIKKKEEDEEMKAELKSMLEAAQWRRLQGLAMEGDDVLLAELDVKAPPKRDEWMTTLPPERKPGGMPMHSTSFSRIAKEGRGDTWAWTDNPSDRAQKAKMKYCL